jgi:hypothetical protein
MSNFVGKMLYFAALAFIPSDEVCTSFDEMMKMDFFVEHKELLATFEKYYVKTYIGPFRQPVGQPAVGERRPPTYAVSEWNCRSQALNEMDKTNNKAEGFHSRFSNHVQCKHPNIFKFMKKLQSEQATRDLQIESMIAGNIYANPKKKYKDNAVSIKLLCEMYEHLTLEGFLVGISRNLSF